MTAALRGKAVMRALARTTPIPQVLRPFQEFTRLEASSGILLMAAAAVAVVWANSPWSASYDDLWHAELTLGVGSLGLSLSLLHWINDGLMAVFFLVVGLEIKRELRGGELAERRKAALPIAAAVGGMVAPAGLYLALNWGSPGARGWGVPMATDIAFALGVLALLGRGVPIALRVFLTALAIVDDLGAVLVIAVFYTAELSLQHLGLGALVLGVLTAANLAGVRRLSIYCLGGAILWLAFLQSGVHATVAGVLLAMTIPSQTTKSISLADRMSALLARQLARMRGGRRPHLSAHESRGHVPPVEHHASSPMHALEHRLHPWVTYGVLPVFALGNAGVSLGGGHLLASLAHPVSLGVMAGLVLGKQLGITLATWVAVRTGLAALPAGMAWRHVYGIGWLGGIGFTMSIFIAGLAFGDGELLNTTKLAIFAGSLCSGAVGWAILRGAVRSPVRSAESEDR